MDELTRKVNEKFLKKILEMEDVSELEGIVYAYLNFTQAAKNIQDMRLDLKYWLSEEGCEHYR